MNRTRRICRSLAGLPRRSRTWLAAAAAAPTLLATAPPRPPGWNKHPPQPARWSNRPHLPPGWNKHPPLPAHAHPVAAGGMPGWQIAVIAAVLLAAALVVTAYQMRAVRRRTRTSTARA